MDVTQFPLEYVSPGILRPHTRNYRTHPEDQIEHLKHSIQEYGIYKNIVISSDNVILAGHGMVVAAQHMGLALIPAHRMPFPSTDIRAQKLLVADNETSRLGFPDDRALTDLLKELHDSPVADLLGTGFDADMLAALTYVTRPEQEIRDKDAAAHWVGMPEYENTEVPFTLVVHFRTLSARQDFMERLGMSGADGEQKTASTWFPAKEREDLRSLRFEDTTR